MKKATQKTMKRILNTLLAGMLILTFGCVPGSNVNLTQGSRGLPGLSLGVQSQNPSYLNYLSSNVSQPQWMQTMIRNIKNKSPYSGPVDIQIDTGLLDKNNANPKVLTVKSLTGGFSIQAVPAGPIVFQEQFVRDKKSIKGEKRDFTVSDTSKVYALHIQNGDAQGNNMVSSAVINLNGQDWVRPNDFRGKQTLEVQKDSILLNANNTMTIDVSGSPGSTMIVTVIEGGLAGTIRRKNGPLNEHPNQDAHNAGNDRNIFDPDDPNSLADLEPFEGDLRGIWGGPAVSRATLNDEVVLDFEPGTVNMVFKDPAGLQAFQELYGATVIDTLDLSIFPELPPLTFYQLSLNLDKSPIHKIETLIRQYTPDILMDIQSAEFSSLAALKTFAIVLDAIVNHRELLISLDLNIISPPSIPESEVNDSINTLENNAWWLRTPGVFDAWDYSLGTGVRAAVSDCAFFRTTQDPEFTRRIIEKRNFAHEIDEATGNLKTDGQGNFTPYPPDNIELPNVNGNGDHGTLMIKGAYAEKDNGIKGVGVSPNTTLRLYVGCKLFEHSKAIMTAIKSEVDVVSLSAAWKTDHPISFTKQSQIFLTGYLGIKFAVYLAQQRSVAFVSSTHNHAKPLIRKDTQGNMKYEWLPASLAGRSFQLSLGGSFGSQTVIGQNIAAGAAQPVNLEGTSAEIWYEVSNEKNILDNTRIIDFDSSSSSGVGSNFDIERTDEVIYAPAEKTIARGTSGAASYLAATIALMKSRNPNLTPLQIKSILRSTATPMSVSKLANSERGRFYGVSNQNVPFVNVKRAVEEAIKLKNPNLLSHKATDIMGVIDNPANLHSSFIRLNDGRSLPLEVTSTGYFPDNGLPTALKHGRVVKLKGWHGNHMSMGQSTDLRSRVEILSVNPVCDLAVSGSIQASCTPADQGLKPKLTQLVNISQGNFITRTELAKSVPFTVELQGENMVANGLKSKPLQLVFRNMGTGQLLPLQVQTTMASIDGTYVKYQGATINQTGSYRMLVRGASGDSNFIGNIPNQGDFKIAAAQVGEAPTDLPFDVKDWIQEGQQAEGESGDRFGLTVIADKEKLKLKLKNESINISGVEVPVLEVVDDFIAFSIPDNLPPEVYDLVIEVDGESITLADVIKVLAPPPPPSPSPTPTSGGGGNEPPVVVSVPIKVSFPAGAGNLVFPFNANVLTSLKGVADSFGNLSQWAKILDLSKSVDVSYPTVPDIRNPGQVDQELPLNIRLQIAKDPQAGGSLPSGTITVDGSVFNLPVENGEVHQGKVIEANFPFAAGEDNGTSIKIKLNASSSSTVAQIIYVIQAKP